MIVVSSGPATEPISTTEAKLHCRIDTSDDDTIVAALIKASRMMAEQELGRALITQTIDAYFDAFPCYPNSAYGGRIIHLPPISAVTGITYVDGAGATQTLAADQYLVDAKSVPARIEPAYGLSWPAHRVQANSIKITCTAGFGAASAVPEAIKQWMLLQIGHWYANREAASDQLAPLPYIGLLLDPFRVGRY
ncbi:MAG: head-tail connector protein [Proteobacteria bacterium]|nr:head-tail connector protein [Pseudomonadota bacterium]